MFTSLIKAEKIIPLSEIKTIFEKKIDPDKTFYLVIGTILGLGLVLGLIFSIKQPYGG